ncbi:hypothetical arsA [Candidatus Moduliflexus flocculans]|uniref:Hypothetical arsA n=1 Tax=Candidatus Moduliflexus flocculans TaxID=1499966 RepID=A0A081BNN8_9BACT|nr:hypothetical arsA [Candidatus Moduliflexus flocculans]
MKHAQILLFIGKGGVGKTTCSVTTAVHLADMGKRVLLVSLDPAHNAGDALDIPLSSAKKSVTPTLDALEIDLEQLIKRYLDHTSTQMRQTYRYLTVFNLEKFFDVIRYSPGIEEHATLEAMQEILLEEAGQYDAIIFDTAPTGLTLRVLALPTISTLWVEKLSGIRKNILQLRSSIANIHGPQFLRVEGVEEPLASEEKTDATMQELQKYHQDAQRIRQTLSNPNLTSVVAVLNPEDMPLFETIRAVEALKKFQIPLKLLLVNKILTLQDVPAELTRKIERQQEVLRKIRASFPKHPVIELPLLSEDPRGLDKLRHFTRDAAEHIASFV